MTAPSYTSWHVGMKVVCVDASRDYLGQETPLEVGRVYRVDKILRHMDVVGVVVGGCPSWHETNAWSARRFRPVQTRQTDISVFTAMLHPKPAKAKKVRA